MNEWISVNDRLPGEGICVLCYWHVMPEEMHVLELHKGEWFRPIGDEHYMPPDFWMPLPEPPK